VILLAEQVSELEVKQYQSYNQGQSRMMEQMPNIIQSYNQGQSRMMEELPNIIQSYRGTQNDSRFA
jgi:hypothetical protein